MKLFLEYKDLKSAFSFLLVVVMLLGAMLLPACTFSLAGDVTPPPQPETALLQETATPGVLLPIVQPNPSKGALLYREFCANCHGERGLGDGSQAENLSYPPSAIGSADVMRAALPVDWYRVVSDGSQGHEMLGFSSGLDNRQRWDVVAYALTLGSSEKELAEGETIYQANCQKCHDTQAGVKWNKPEALAQRSLQDLWKVISEGRGEMPSFAVQLGESQRWSAAAYVRSLWFAGAQAGEQSEDTLEETSSSALSSLNIRGKIVHFDGAPVDGSGLTVKLLGYVSMEAVELAAVETGADGSFSFGEVALGDAQVLVAQAEYRRVSYISEVVHVADLAEGEALDLTVQVFESSSDTAALEAARLHIFFNFDTPDVLQVIQLLIVKNNSTQFVIPPENGEPLLFFSLPSESANLQFEDESALQRFMPMENGFGDMGGIEPGGETQVLFAYDLPYNAQGILRERKQALSLSLPLSVGDVTMMIPVKGVRLQSEQLAESGERDVQGMQIKIFTMTDLPAGEPLEFTVSGLPASSGAGNNSYLGLTIGLAALGLALVAAGFWYNHWSKNQDDEGEESDMEAGEQQADGLPATEEELLDAIVALDDMKRAGELPEEAYLERRAELKKRLKAIREEGAQQSSD